MPPERASPGGQPQYRVAFLTATRYRELDAHPDLSPADYWKVAAGWSR